MSDSEQQLFINGQSQKTVKYKTTYNTTSYKYIVFWHHYYRVNGKIVQL